MKRVSPSYYYMEVIERPLLDKLSHSVKNRVVTVNFGKVAPFGAAYKICDETETAEIKFENAIAAVNYYGAMGWEVVTAYEQADAASYETHFLLRFDATRGTNAMTRAIDSALDTTPVAKLK